LPKNAQIHDILEFLSHMPSAHTISGQRLSLRTSLIITIVAMGVLGLMLALLSGAKR
jgi:VIT1/CCC1 family predicted Fe2+/Mn2+ transporter